MSRDPNTLPVPRRIAKDFNAVAYAEGWRACESGKTHDDNPYTAASIYVRPSPDCDAWTAGFVARGNVGFSVEHLPRLPSGGFAF